MGGRMIHQDLVIFALRHHVVQRYDGEYESKILFISWRIAPTTSSSDVTDIIHHQNKKIQIHLPMVPVYFFIMKTYARPSFSLRNVKCFLRSLFVQLKIIWLVSSFVTWTSTSQASVELFWYVTYEVGGTSPKNRSFFWFMTIFGQISSPKPLQNRSDFDGS